MIEGENFEPLQSLQLIESMINKAKNRFTENGHLYLLWGWVVLICSLVQFVASNWNLLEHPEIVWMLTWVAFVYQIIYLARNKKKSRVSTYTDEILKAVWLVFVGCGILVGFVISKKANWETMYPLILMLYGIPSILSGTILKFKPLVIGGIICWILCIICCFIPFIYNFLMVSIAVIVAWIIPGYLMQARYKRENN